MPDSQEKTKRGHRGPYQRWFRKQIDGDAILTRAQLRARWPGAAQRSFMRLERNGVLKRIWLNGCTVGYRLSEITAYESSLDHLRLGVMPERIVHEIGMVDRYTTGEILMIWQAIRRQVRRMAVVEQRMIVNNIAQSLS